MARVISSGPWLSDEEDSVEVALDGCVVLMSASAAVAVEILSSSSCWEEEVIWFDFSLAISCSCCSAVMAVWFELF